MLKKPSEAQHRIREDIDFCELKIDDCFITNQWQTFPRIFFLLNFVQTMHLLLFIHQLRGDIEHLLQSEIFIVLDETLNNWEILPMNVAAFIVAAMNIHHIIECSSPDSATFDILFCLFRTWSLTSSTNSAASLPMTKFSDSASQVSPIHRESSLRTLRNAHFRREEVFHYEGHLVASYPKKFSQVSLIDRAPQLHFSTFEKTKIDHNLLLNKLVVTVSQVSPIDRHLQQIFQDLDIHTRSSPGLMELMTTRPKASSQCKL